MVYALTLTSTGMKDHADLSQEKKVYLFTLIS